MKPRRLRLLIMHVSTRCDEACVHCSVWRRRDQGEEITTSERVSLIREARALGAKGILFTGGEPLLCADLGILARAARDSGLTVQIATNGLALSQAKAWLGDVVSEIFVSVEGIEAVHDAVRGPGTFSRLRTSLAGVLALPKRPRLVGRSVISSRNAGGLVDTVAAARELGLDALSFLPVDTSTTAFGGEPGERGFLRPRPADLAALREAIRALAAAGEPGAFVLETEARLTRMADALESAAGSTSAPECDAPEWASVVEADGAVRPCFFQPAITGPGYRPLRAIRASEGFARALRHLGQANETCRVCVCPKYAPGPLAALSSRMGRGIARAWPLRQPEARLRA